MAYQLKDEKGEVVKHDGNEVFATDVIGAVKAVNKDERTLVIVGSDETKDRDGDIIMVSGWEMENFRKNPVFLFAHDHHGVPIGSATKVVRRKNPARLEFHEKFPSEGIYPFADMILALFQEKVLNASSVGFMPKKWEELEKTDDDVERWFPGRRFVKQELLELSAVAVPSNPSALQINSLVKSFKTKSLDEIKEMMNPKDRDLILEQLFVKEIEIEDEDKSFMVQVPEQINEEATSEEFVTVKGEFENENKETAEVKEEVKEDTNEEEDMTIQEIKDLFEQIAEKLELIEDSQAVITEDVANIKSFIGNLTKVDENDTSEVDSKSASDDDKADNLYDDLLNQDDNKEVVGETEDELTEEEQKVLCDAIKTIREKLNSEVK